MNSYKIGVRASGVILLGQDVSCDGFHRDYRVRVQTHVHVDHMSHFETSKGLQDIILTDATFQLLNAEFNADIPVRNNIVALAYSEAYVAGKSRTYRSYAWIGTGGG
jgi:hypothetical protein